MSVSGWHLPNPLFFSMVWLPSLVPAKLVCVPGETGLFLPPLEGLSWSPHRMDALTPWQMQAMGTRLGEGAVTQPPQEK